MKKPRNNRVSLTVDEIAKSVGATVEGNGSVSICAAAPIENAGSDEISFLANKRYEKYLASTGAGAVIIDNNTPCSHKSILRHPQPYFAFAQIIDLLYPVDSDFETGVHPSSVVCNNSQIESTASVGPFCHIESGSIIGANCRLISSVYIGKNVTIGDNSLIYPGVMIMNDSTIGSNVIIHSSTVVGSDGFGFVPTKEGIKKIRQVGWVEIGDNVEIGSNVSIDRGALGSTKIGRGTKIDNLVQIAHNVQTGENCLIVAQVGISGSTKLGKNVTLAGQAGLTGHIEIGDGAMVGAQAGVSKSVSPGISVTGTNARPLMDQKRIEAAMSRLPELLKRVKELEKKLNIESGD